MIGSGLLTSAEELYEKTLALQKDYLPHSENFFFQVGASTFDVLHEEYLKEPQILEIVKRARKFHYNITFSLMVYAQFFRGYSKALADSDPTQPFVLLQHFHEAKLGIKKVEEGWQQYQLDLVQLQKLLLQTPAAAKKSDSFADDFTGEVIISIEKLHLQTSTSPTLYFSDEELPPPVLTQYTLSQNSDKTSTFNPGIIEFHQDKSSIDRSYNSPK